VAPASLKVEADSATLAKPAARYYNVCDHAALEPARRPMLRLAKDIAYSLIDAATRPWGLPRTLNGRRWRLSARCWRAFPEGWEAELEKFLDSAVEPGMVVADVGAHVGIHTLGLARRVGRDGHVYAFEPVPAVATLLARHVRLNRLEERVTLIESAVGARDDQVQMHVDPKGPDPGNSFVARPYAPRLTRILVKVLPLDDFFEARGTPPSVIKIDVEGYERRVVQGSARLLEAPNAPVVVCALHPWHLQQLGESEKDFFDTVAGLGLEVLTLQGAPTGPQGVYREVVIRQPGHRLRGWN
jgi:FkbM family methyltransferase